jgi:pimeloyl-ACP methyl ester carboxylesterase
MTRTALAILLPIVLRAQQFGGLAETTHPVLTGIPAFSTEDLSRTGFFYVGGKYVGKRDSLTMAGSAYVEAWIPKQIKHPYPIVYLHGAGMTATCWQQTPDGRPGWAYYFAKQGYVQYMMDSPTRGRSPYVPGHDGKLSVRTAPEFEAERTASARKGDFPRAHLHSQFPGAGLVGDPIFDAFARTQVQYVSRGGPFSQDDLSHDALASLLGELKTPVIIVSHSQGGPAGWRIADSRPSQVKAIITLEPSGPPIQRVDTAHLSYGNGDDGLVWGVTASPMHYDPAAGAPSDLHVVLQTKSEIPGDVVPCYVQTEPARKLINLEKIPVLFLSSEGGYHREYDHCTAKWLNQAGVKTTFIRMEDVGIRGNGHDMMLERNSDDVAKLINNWIERNARPLPDDKAVMARPPSSIPTFPVEQIARSAFFYAGGKYIGKPGKEIMNGSMYTEIWTPNHIRHSHPIVLLHGNGQSGAIWRQTPDGRQGWAYYLIDQGYTVYMVDEPATGRSSYTPGVDGELEIRTAQALSSAWTAPLSSNGHFPQMEKYTQWPSQDPHRGTIGDPVFDTFAKGQMQFSKKSDELAVAAVASLLDTIGKPVILITHAEGGAIGFNVADQRPTLVASMVTVEPAGPQIGNVDVSRVAYSGVNPDSWGLTSIPMRYEPPFKGPADIKVHLGPSERSDEVPCYLQDSPVHKLAGYQGKAILSISGEGSQHRVFDACIPKWVNQAGANAQFVRLEDVGIHGNMHEMFFDRNSDDIIKFIDRWLDKNDK